MTNETRYRAVLSVTLATFVIEVLGSFATHSHGLLSDALHLFGDGIPFALGWLCISIVLPEDVEALIGYLNVIFLLVAAVYIAVQGIYRVYHPVEVDKAVFVLASIGFIGNAAQLYFAWGLGHAHKHASTYRSQILHLSADVLSSAAVLVGSYLVARTGNSRMDTYASLAVAAVTLWAAWHCYCEVSHVDGHTHHEHGEDCEHAHEH